MSFLPSKCNCVSIDYKQSADFQEEDHDGGRCLHSLSNTFSNIIPVGDKGHIEIRPLTTDELSPETLDAFLAVGFTNHYEILAQKKDIEQRLFYIVNCATGFWNGDKLKYYMKDDLFGKRGNMPNNFATTIANVDLRSRVSNLLCLYL